MKSLLALAFATTALLAVAAHAADEPQPGDGAKAQQAAANAERERLNAEHAAVNSRFAEAQKACRAKFAVTDCIKKAQREHNQAVSDLRRQERVLNEAERIRRAAEHQRAVDERNAPEKKQAEAERHRQAAIEQAEREAKAAEKARKKAEDDAQKAARGPHPPKAPPEAHGPHGTPRPPHAAASHGLTPEEIAKNRAAYDARIREADAHNAQLREKLATRKKPAASDLPIPQ